MVIVKLYEYLDTKQKQGSGGNRTRDLPHPKRES